MSRRVSAYQARTHLGEILDAVRYRKEPCIIERNGRPSAVIVDVEAYQALEALREEERYIEEYTDERMKEFLTADRLAKTEAQRVKGILKSAR